MTQNNEAACINELQDQIDKHTDDIEIYIINQDTEILDKLSSMFQGQFYSKAKVFSLEQKEIMTALIDEATF